MSASVLRLEDSGERAAAADTVIGIDREFVTSAKKNSRILTNFPKLKKFVKIRKKIR